MKKYLMVTLLAISTLAEAKDTYVRGYTRSNGTYVAPHVRSSPDSSTENNYGRKSANSYGTYDRDSDNDGLLNQYDKDDNNNGKSDNDE